MVLWDQLIKHATIKKNNKYLYGQALDHKVLLIYQGADHAYDILVLFSILGISFAVAEVYFY